ncbi:hypothetical protein B0J11DRAFT_444940 [Dendryphion nanum]|uniref:Methyltransferase domain-containing protein n=1 Tax=Dendryphion nanum TaxID=256645 RepID=A0A9P9ICH8_9PLEO|nr:hypothetical protein B0J11DRAFT_444940 [Dendryphion nanum]
MSKPPAFGSQQYWNARFTSNPNPFEWLHPPDSLDLYLENAVQVAKEECPKILHIGCGTSLLSYHLRNHVNDPELIHNLDYSQVAIDAGREREMDLCANEEESKQGSTNLPDIKSMRWSAADLLNYSSLLGVCDRGTYSIIVDKSTSDSIACADDINVPLPYPVNTFPLTSPLEESLEPVDPLHILAVHIALLAKPKARWLCLSYSTDRYPFLQNSYTISQDTKFDLDNISATGFPDPAKLWKIVARDEIEVLQTEGEAGTDITHRPKIVDWMYVLERTDVPLYVNKF